MALKAKAAGGGRRSAMKAAAQNMFGQENMAAGRWVNRNFLPKNLVGRVDVNPTAEDTSVLNRMNDLSKGLNADQYQAAREQQSKGLQSDLNTQMANLAKSQAQTRTYGAAASAQQANALRADSEKRADLEQQNKLADVNLINQGTKDYAATLKNQEDTTFEKQKYNAGNKMALAASRLGGFFNTVGIGKTDKQQADMLELQKQMIAAARG